MEKPMKAMLVSLFVLVLASWPVGLLTKRVSASSVSDYREVDLTYLYCHMEELCGTRVKAVGKVVYAASVYMFEDFWLGGQGGGAVPVVVRFAGLLKPDENLTVEVSGMIEHCKLEGGFYYLSAQELREASESEPPHMPEFSAATIVSMLIFALAFAAVLRRGKATAKAVHP